MVNPELISESDQSSESTTLASRTYESIKADIINGTLTQGSKIVESDLALKYGISRGPLREAIHRLEQIKLIIRIPHAGSRVVTLNSKMMEDIYTARESLEGMAARLAARHMPDDNIQSLHQLLDQHEQNITEAQGKIYFQREGDIDFSLSHRGRQPEPVDFGKLKRRVIPAHPHGQAPDLENAITPRCRTGATPPDNHGYRKPRRRACRNTHAPTYQRSMENFLNQSSRTIMSNQTTPGQKLRQAVED